MLYTNLKHIENAEDFARNLNQHINVVIVCGSMTPSSVTMFRITEELAAELKNIHFFDMEFDNPSLKEHCITKEIPLILIYKNGKLLKTIQEKTKEEIKSIIHSQLNN